MIGEQHLAHDQMGTPNHKPPTRVRWTPSQIQFQILERLFEQDNGTPNKQHLKEIADELRQHGQIAETNVYNWFQNRKARAKRRHQQVAWRCRTHLNQAKGAQQVSMKNGDSEVDTDADSPRQKQPRHDRELTQNNSENFAHVKRISFDQGNRSGNEQSPGQIDHHEWQQVTVSSVLVEEDDIKPKIPFIAGGFDPHGFAQGHNLRIYLRSCYLLCESVNCLTSYFVQLVVVIRMYDASVVPNLCNPPFRWR
jgi:hypothetical protein